MANLCFMVNRPWESIQETKIGFRYVAEQLLDRHQIAIFNIPIHYTNFLFIFYTLICFYNRRPKHPIG